MGKQTLKFDCLINMARFAKTLFAGYLMNTNKFTITGRFTEEEIRRGQAQYGAELIETSEKIYTY